MFPPGLGVETLAAGRRPAVIMVDLMQAYFEPGCAFDLGSTAVLGPAASVLAAARAGGHPVVHTRVEFDRATADASVFVRKVPSLRDLAPGARLGRLRDEVAPTGDEPVVVKQAASAFFGTSLAEDLHERGVDTVVITGVSTSGCVRATAVDALQHDLVPVVVSDAVADRAPGPHHATLYDLRSKYGSVVDAAGAVRYLERTA
ncbi:UNVERIFIED_CONTAM: isochorismatase [Mumia flava]